ncbi:hypothetical protein H634G_11547 [Metarhizium anisopliae BRIP 53293]|uniref:Uncharacterized protein n=1 Tax=Metarhizium anisopliae BRIP 53293 TaxID=1291518 RepID=A0A0D9NHA7_METAN|nr:hypothetical protein H634G_11547 [Metarhizium anisopliae BRIP 53293]
MASVKAPRCETGWLHPDGGVLTEAGRATLGRHCNSAIEKAGRGWSPIGWEDLFSHGAVLHPSEATQLWTALNNTRRPLRRHKVFG